MSALRTLRVGAPTRRIGLSPVLDPARRRATLPTNAACVAQLPNCRRSRSFDLPGALLATIGLSCVTFGLLERSSQRTPSHLCGAIGLLLLVLFVLVERRTLSPLVPMELFQNRNFTGASLLTLFLYGALFCNAVLSSSKPHSGLSRPLPLGLRPS